MLYVPLIDASPTVQAQVRILRNQEDVRKYMYTSHEISEEEHSAWIRSLTGNDKQQVFVIMSDDNAVGVVSLNAINTTHKTADWAFYLDVTVQGKGIGTLVEFWMLDHAFNEVGLEKLNCEVLITNASVIKMHQRFGFEIEGTRRHNIIKDGQRIDVVLLGITKCEWVSRRSSLEPVIARLSRPS